MWRDFVEPRAARPLARARHAPPPARHRDAPASPPGSTRPMGGSSISGSRPRAIDGRLGHLRAAGRPGRGRCDRGRSGGRASARSSSAGARPSHGARAPRPSARDPAIPASPSTLAPAVALVVVLVAAVVGTSLRERSPSPPTPPGAGDRWQSVLDAGGALPRRTRPGPADRHQVRVTQPPVTPDAEPTPGRRPSRPGRVRSRAAADPSRHPPTPTPTPEPVREPVDGRPARRIPRRYFASQVEKDWCSPSGVQMVLAIHGQVVDRERDPAGDRRPRPRVGIAGRQSQRRVGSGGDGPGPRGLRRAGLRGPRASRRRQGALRDARPDHPGDERAGHPADLARCPHLGHDAGSRRCRPDRLPPTPSSAAPTSWTRGTRASRRSGARPTRRAPSRTTPRWSATSCTWKRPGGPLPGPRRPVHHRHADDPDPGRRRADLGLRRRATGSPQAPRRGRRPAGRSGRRLPSA